MLEGKIIYEVNLDVKKAVEGLYKSWLLKHVEDMLRIKGFEKAEVAEEDPESGIESLKMSVRYTLSSLQDLNHYFDHEAEKMRAQGLDKFEGQFSASRRILRLNQELISDSRD